VKENNLRWLLFLLRFCTVSFANQLLQLMQTTLLADDFEYFLDLRHDDRVQLLLQIVQNVFVADQTSRERMHLQVHLARLEHQVAGNIDAITV